jgi:hypothetical protein
MLFPFKVTDANPALNQPSSLNEKSNAPLLMQASKSTLATRLKGAAEIDVYDP